MKIVGIYKKIGFSQVFNNFDRFWVSLSETYPYPYKLGRLQLQLHLIGKILSMQFLSRRERVGGEVIVGQHVADIRSRGSYN